MSTCTSSSSLEQNSGKCSGQAKIYLTGLPSNLWSKFCGRQHKTPMTSSTDSDMEVMANLCTTQTASCLFFFKSHSLTSKFYISMACKIKSLIIMKFKHEACDSSNEHYIARSCYHSGIITVALLLPAQVTLACRLCKWWKGPNLVL